MKDSHVVIYETEIIYPEEIEEYRRTNEECTEVTQAQRKKIWILFFIEQQKKKFLNDCFFT